MIVLSVLLRPFLFLLLLCAAAVARGQPSPNILLLIAEDLSPRIGAYGDDVARTPHLDALAEQGVRYARVFTTSGVCAPSRAALMTGRHAISFGAQHMRTSSRPSGAYTTVPPPGVVAFPELLRAAGYYTYTDEKLDYQFSGVLWGSGPLTIWDAEGPDTHWRNRIDGRPFFGLVNFTVTHESGVFRQLGSWPHSVAHFVMQVIRFAMFGPPPSDRTPPASVVLPPYYPDTPTVRADVARHYDNVMTMDAQVGSLLVQLEEDGLADSTIVIWTTDHGDGLPRAKRELYDSGLHVPMIIRWPERYRPANVEPGGWDHRLMSFIDLSATILDLADVAVPQGVSGKSFVDPSFRREYVYAAGDRNDEVVDRRRAVRDGRLKYVRHYYPELPGAHGQVFRDNIDMMREMRSLYAAGELDPVQRLWFESPGSERLYDTVADPHEVVDLSRDPAHAPDLERMRRVLDAWLTDVGDTSEEPEDVMVERFWPGGAQPVTPAPVIELRNGVADIRSDVGASLAVRIDAGRWYVYDEPIRVDPGMRVEARAVRYGWRASEAVGVTVR